MEGLEISLINKSDLERTTRIDAEFYQKQNLIVLGKLQKRPLNSIAKVTSVSDGNHMSISDNFAYEGIPYYRGQNIHNFFIEDSSPIYIDKKTYNLPTMLRSHLHKGDVLLSIVGTIGGVSLVTSDQKSTCNCKLAILRPRNIDGYYLAIYLKTIYGQNQIKKFIRGAVQKGLILEDLDQIFIPELSVELAKSISKIVTKIQDINNSSKQAYQQAETLLLKELGLENFKPIEQAVNIKSFKESFASTGRLDAEYYQPKYESTIHKIKSSNYKKLIQLVSIKKSIEPGSEVYDTTEGIPFIRVSDYSKMGITDPAVKLNLNYYHSNQEELNKLFPKKDTILFSKDGSIGIAYQVKEDLKAITSGAILHLNILDNIEDILPEYLTLVLNSFMVQMQAERDAGGSIINHWRIDQIEDVIIPIIPNSIQQQITELIQQSFTLKAQSEHLLEVAKQAVEIAIEQSEAAALDFINRECGDA